jgi:hypothetical protein
MNRMFESMVNVFSVFIAFKERAGDANYLTIIVVLVASAGFGSRPHHDALYTDCMPVKRQQFSETSQSSARPGTSAGAERDDRQRRRV